jgi:hypothetical protein
VDFAPSFVPAVHHRITGCKRARQFRAHYQGIITSGHFFRAGILDAEYIGSVKEAVS